MSSVSLRALAELVGGEIVGDADIEIRAARPVFEARAGDITLFEHDKYLEAVKSSAASAVVVGKNVCIEGKTVLRVHDPLLAFIEIVRTFRGRQEAKPLGIHPRACVHPSAQIGPDPSIHPLAVVGENCVIGARCVLHSGAVIGANCKIGDDVVIHANAVLYEGTVLGHRVIIHSGAVIGADGFGYRQQAGRHVKVPQLGYVEIGDDVEIGACTTIDRGTFGATRIGTGTKIDNLVQVAHNCHIGKHNLLVSQMGIAGSSTTGDYVVIAGQVGIVDHVHIGDRVMIGAQAGVTKDVAPGQRILGSPATPERDQKRMLMSLEKLPELRRDVKRIKQHLGLDEDRNRKAG
ncbi:MAG: UDP-3-O-acylglucosamine N-acyltransferase [Gemmatales bacterium]|nr:MAG: UDP-3-O-acylglucosamine N-acyltransferase [Gemmatales bacterium]